MHPEKRTVSISVDQNGQIKISDDIYTLFQTNKATEPYLYRDSIPSPTQLGRFVATLWKGVGVWLVRVNYNADNCESQSLPSLYLVRNRARSRRNLRENDHR